MGVRQQALLHATCYPDQLRSLTQALSMLSTATWLARFPLGLVFEQGMIPHFTQR
jgi:hypothetical protein